MAKRIRDGAFFAACLSSLIVGCSAAPGSSGAPSGATSSAGTGGSLSGAGHAAHTGGNASSESTGPRIVVGAGGQTTPTPGASGGSGGACGSEKLKSELRVTEVVVEVPGNVLFVFDQSSSMNEPWNGSTKWNVANTAMINAFTPLQDKLQAGAIMFPTGNFDQSSFACDWIADFVNCPLLAGKSACPEVAPIASAPQITIQPGVNFLGKWRQLWTATPQASGVGTPTERGLLQAEAALATPPPGNTAVVLITDGEPTCGKGESAIAARLLQKGIKTYVVGLPGATGATFLDSVAQSGGTAPANCTDDCYLSPADGAAFQSALATIATKTISTMTTSTVDQCEFSLTPPSGAAAGDVHLIVTEASTQKKYEIPRPSGWDLVGNQASLSDSVCALARSGAFSELEFEYGCVTVPPLPPR